MREDSQVGKKVLLGEVNGVFGVQGWVKVFSDTSPRENIIGFKSWYLSKDKAARELGARGSSKGKLLDDSDSQWTRFKLVRGRRQGKNVVAQLEGVVDRDGAEALVGRRIAVDRDQLPDLSADEYYWSDLLGFSVVNLEQQRLGNLDRMFETGANDVMVVCRLDPETGVAGSGVGNEILVPWVRESVIVSVDVKEKLITVDWDPDY